MFEDEESVPDGMRVCDCCGGNFFPEDMDGDHCFDCLATLFGDDA